MRVLIKLRLVALRCLVSVSALCSVFIVGSVIIAVEDAAEQEKRKTETVLRSEAPAECFAIKIHPISVFHVRRDDH